MKYRTANKLCDLDAAYLAGLVDGEGTIASLVHVKGGIITGTPIISIANTDYALVAWPLKITGAGFI